MTTIQNRHDIVVVADPAGGTTAARRVLAVLRMAFGLTFLWAFLDKLLALGFHTGYDQDGTLDRFGPAAWVNGGSPTEGYLTFVPDGPFASFYNGLAGQVWIDWLFMAALLGVGLSLTFGFAMRLGAISGVLLYLMMWTVVLPPENHPFLDEHVLGALTITALALLHADRTWGLGNMWARTPLARKLGFLR